MKTKSTNSFSAKPIITRKQGKRKRIIIQGITEAGDDFKPSDWAERMSGRLCTFENHRITYSPLLHPLMKGGQKCIAIDPQLKNYHPDLYSSILKFAMTNQLKICMDNTEVEDEY